MGSNPTWGAIFAHKKHETPDRVVFPTPINHTQLVCSLLGEDRRGLVGANFITGCESQKDSGSAIKDIHEGYGTSSIYGNARRNPCKAGSTPDHPANFGRNHYLVMSLGSSPSTTANFGRLAQLLERLALRSQEVGGSTPSSPANFGWGACFMTRPSGRTTPNRQLWTDATWKMGRAQSHVGSV